MTTITDRRFFPPFFLLLQIVLQIVNSLLFKRKLLAWEQIGHIMGHRPKPVLRPLKLPFECGFCAFRVELSAFAPARIRDHIGVILENSEALTHVTGWHSALSAVGLETI